MILLIRAGYGRNIVQVNTQQASLLWIGTILIPLKILNCGQNMKKKFNIWYDGILLSISLFALTVSIVNKNWIGILLWSMLLIYVIRLIKQSNSQK